MTRDRKLVKVLIVRKDMHPRDTQVGIYLWDLEILDWTKVTIEDIKDLVDSGPNYSKRYAYDANGNVEYMGYAAPGTSTATAGWKIIKNTWTSGNITASGFASGRAEFIFKWDDYASYSYS